MEDDKVASFFKDMRAADEHVVIPPFPREKETRRPSRRFLYAAAAVMAVIVAGVFLVRPAGADQTSAGEIVIDLSHDAFTSQSLAPMGDETLSGWESPTTSLLEEY
jgi:hypothetical protein